MSELCQIVHLIHGRASSRGSGQHHAPQGLGTRDAVHISQERGARVAQDHRHDLEGRVNGYGKSHTHTLYKKQQYVKDMFCISEVRNSGGGEVTSR